MTIPEAERLPDPAVTVCFEVSISGAGLGLFQTCEGLGLEVVIEQREEGGNNGFVWQLPTRIKYSNVKLSRPVGKDSAKLTAWLASFATGVTRQTATIAAKTVGEQDGRDLEPRRGDPGALVRTQSERRLAEGGHGDRRAGPPRIPPGEDDRPEADRAALNRGGKGPRQAGRRPRAGQAGRRPAQDGEGEAHPLRPRAGTRRQFPRSDRGVR